MTSGTDLNPWSANPTSVAVNVTHQLAQQNGCPTAPSQDLIDCLRSRDAEDLINVNITIVGITYVTSDFRNTY